jgi:hypothetical protein
LLHAGQFTDDEKWKTCNSSLKRRSQGFCEPARKGFSIATGNGFYRPEKAPRETNSPTVKHHLSMVTFKTPPRGPLQPDGQRFGHFLEKDFETSSPS